jgi:hypothetical protein
MYNTNLLQLTKNLLPEYLTNFNLEQLNNNWTYDVYKYYDADSMLNFIIKNPSNKLLNAAQTFTKFNLNELKWFYFILYYLFINGGIYINENVVLKENILQLDFSKELIVVESIIGQNELFYGFIFSHKNNKIIELFLKKLEKKFDENIFNNDGDVERFIKKELYTDISIFNNISITTETEIKTMICKEYILNNISNIGNHDLSIIYAEHYFNPNSKIFTLPNNSSNKLPKIYKNVTKIAVTFNITNSVADMFSNGINQNSLYLAELLLNAGFDVCFVVDDNKLNSQSKITLGKIMYDPRFKYFPVSDILTLDLDILIQLSFSFWQDVKLIRMMKYTNIKLVGYFCGNSYIINSEKILYNQHKSRDNTRDCFQFTLENNEPILDEIWSIPQMVNTNLHYWKTLYRCNCIEIPFIWSTNSYTLTLKHHIDMTENDFKYVNRGEKKNIGIFEPNLSIMKWCLPCIIICENTYRQNKNIKHIYITNINSTSNSQLSDASKKQDETKKINEFNLTSFNHMLVSLDIFKNKLCTIESRYNTMFFMSKYCDIAVSHQWENPLNYLYFDLAWMGWPIIHNAHLCRDVGYYYEGFNYEEGGVILDEVINIHDNNIDEYILRNRTAIDKYLPTNLELQNKYKQIILTLIDN